MNQNVQLRQEPVRQLVLKYSIPAIIGMIVVALYNAIDRMFIGNIPNIGDLAIAGVGVTMPISSLIIAFEMLVGIGASTVIANKLGQGKKEEAEHVLGNTFTLGIIVGLIFTIGGFLGLEPILKMMGAGQESMVYAKSYAEIILLGVTPYIVGFALNTTIRANGNPRLAAATLIVSCLLNIVLDPLFIFGFKWGIQGAAWATIISQCIVTVWVLLYYTKGKSNLKLRKTYFKLENQYVKSILTIGASAFAMQVAASLVQLAANNALKTYGGDLAIGAMAAISSIAMMFTMPVHGINQGTLPIVGFNYGAGLKQRARQAFFFAMWLAIGILTVGTILVEIFPAAAIKLFGSSEELIDIAVSGIRIYICMLPLSAIALTGANYFLAMGKAKESMFLGLLRQVIIFIPLVIILPKFMGLKGVWVAQALSDGLAAFITILFLRRVLTK